MPSARGISTAPWSFAASSLFVVFAKLFVSLDMTTNVRWESLDNNLRGQSWEGKYPCVKVADIYDNFSTLSSPA